MSFDFCCKWLFCALVFQGLFGLALAVLGPELGLLGFYPYFTDSLWGLPAEPELVQRFSSWLFGVLGATTLAWGALMACIVAVPFRRREPWAWWALVLSLTLWYPLDTTLSLTSGVWPNAILNTLALLMILPPLLATRKAFVS